MPGPVREAPNTTWPASFRFARGNPTLENRTPAAIPGAGISVIANVSIPASAGISARKVKAAMKIVAAPIDFD
jgi:hypothetical protein